MSSPADRYVNVANPTPLAPYTNWTTAATVIQDAIDAASVGETVWVTNGVYATGGRAVVGFMTNRVTIDKAIAVRSVNGPSVTHIAGSPAPGTAEPGPGAMRCAWVAAGATLQGFTLTNGFTLTLGDWYADRSGGGACCDSTEALVSNCTFAGNAANMYGGGIHSGTAIACMFRGNRAAEGGGLSYAKAINCGFVGNSATVGGAARNCTMTNCTAVANTTTTSGGVANCTTVGCLLWGNTRTGSTIVSNYAGGLHSWSCTQPLPPGTGNTTNDPLLVGMADFHILTGSSCIDAAPTDAGPARDLEGDLRPQGIAPDIGCDETGPGTGAGPVTSEIHVSPASLVEPIPGRPVDFVSLASGPARRIEWVFDDGVRVTNRTTVSHAFSSPGLHAVLLLAGGATGAVSVAILPGERFVSPTGDDVADGKSWATAKATIQGGVDACPWPGMTVWVTNGVYATGGRAAYGIMTNRVTIGAAIAVRSVNGPSVTHIVGSPAPGSTNPGPGAVRCAWIAAGATLQGFTLTNGSTLATGDENHERSGGGAFCQSPEAIVSNCVVAGNCAHTHGGGVQWGRAEASRIRGNRAATGAGVWDNVAINCFLYGNTASTNGGAASGNTMTNCTVVGNDAPAAGGISGVNAVGCIVWDNVQTGTTNLSNHSGGSLTFTCSQPLPSGTGNISQDPVFVGLGDFHLLPGSPCIDAANPAAAAYMDLDGDARPQGAAPDMGCDEAGPGTGSGPITAAAAASPGEVGAGFAAEFTSYAAGAAWQLEWVFDDGFRATNLPSMRHSTATPGMHEILLIATGVGGTTTGRTTVLVTDEKYFVSPSGNDEAPGTNWATAKATIQAAVDACTLPGATVWATNGVYATGGRAVDGVMTNRVTIDGPVVVRSVNGPVVTTIAGAPADGGDVGAGATRCVWMGKGALLLGFTLSNGFTQASGDEVTERSGGGAWVQPSGGVLSNCVVSGNRAASAGAGIYGGTALDCRLEGNRAGGRGGGAAGGILADCTLSNNAAATRGGAADSAALERCVLIGNQAVIGAGAYGGFLDRCIVRDNQSSGTGAAGGGLAVAAARSTALIGNMTSGEGGGAYASSLTNCTILVNTAAVIGGGVRTSTSVNNIVHHNFAPGCPTNRNHDGRSFSYSCTEPLPAGTGNFTNAPGLSGVGNPLLLSGSRCIDAGLALPDPGPSDLDGEARVQGGGLDTGADEFLATTHAGAIAISLVEDGRIQGATAEVDLWVASTGRIDSLVWDFGDGQAATNDAAVRHAFASPGIYAVRVRAVNADHAVEATRAVSLLDEAYVSPAGDDSAPGTNWATAKATIQAAVDACMPSGAVVRVTNGVYATGGRPVVGTMTNRLVLDRPITVIGVGGARSTIILGQPSPQGGGAGDGAIRCVWMTPGAALVGFTLSNGFTRVASNAPAETCGGAVWCVAPSCVISQCVIEGNAACADGGGVLGGTLAECVVRFNTAQRGGGIASNTAANSFVARNVATGEGGGSFASRLTHCSVLANHAATAGGMWGGAATNSIVYFNTAGDHENHSSPSFVGSCTRPLPWGQANLDADPGLGGVASPWLLPGSPCIDAGLTPLSIGVLDLDGETRLQGLSVDIGCDEFAPSAPTAAPLASILAPWTELATDYGIEFQADTSGQVSSLGWDFGDGTSTSGVAGVSHAFAEPGTYEVRLVASNLAGIVTSAVTVRVERAERFVAPTGDDLAPGTNWATAKATIQGGVDACSLPGTLVWVTNGAYAAGGRTVGASMTNRVAIDRPIRVFSVGGPAETLIVGARSAGAADGCSTDSVRCVWMTNGAWIAGFTLTNGFSSADAVNTNERSGGGAWCASRSAVLSNCVIRDCGARFSGGGVFRGSLTDCEISGCAATNGGGAADARLDGCLVSSNRAVHGAGAFLSDSRDSVFLENVAVREGGGAKYGFHDAGEFRGNTAVTGGGANQGLMRNCLVAENTAGSWGGGSFSCTSETCLVTGNVAGEGGGGFGGRLFNCGVMGNRAATNGGGARSARLINCTVAGNRAPLGPGTHLGTMINSIVYLNAMTNGVPAEYSGGVFEYSCTMPMPAGPGNITNMPMLAGMDNPRLLVGSPCIDAGTNGDAWGDTDLYGEARLSGVAVDIGCDEFADGPRQGPISVAAAAGWNAWASGHPGGFSAFTTGAVGRLVWDFGDGVRVTNDAAPDHAFALPGTYDVRLIAGNDDGVSTNIVQVVIGASPLYVAPGGDDAAAGTNWATAKATLQAAVDASAFAGTVWVTSGVYTAGGRIMEGTLSNRVAIHRRMYVRSVDGPESTFIVGAASPTNTGLGAEAVRCAWLTNGAVLAGFTLTNGFTRYVNEEWSPEEIGGGAIGTSPEAVLSNCVLQGNGAVRGGGAGNVTIVDSTLVSNRAISYGGGAYYCFVSNCVVASNWAGGNGGGVGWSRVERSRIEANWASGFGGMGTGTSRWCVIVGNRTPGIGGGCGNSLSSGDIIASNHADIAGGAYQGWLFNCFIHDNRSLSAAGGAYMAGLYNCTVVWNTMEGTHLCMLRNTISYFNSPLNNVAPITGGWNCSWPLISGSGCITNEPMLAGRTNPHLLPGSPCINAANTEFPPNTNLGDLLAWDVDGEARTNGVAVDIGCDEFVLAGCTGAVGATLSASWTNVAPGYPISIDVDAEGRLLEFALDAPGATILSNGNYRCDLAFATPGAFPITATAGNLGGASTSTMIIVVSSGMGFVSPHGSDAAPGTNWATAKATLQAAADDYLTVGGTIWVTNGVYASGGRVVGDLLTNRVAFPRPVTMRSVNGPADTLIVGTSGPTNSRPGGGAVRCAWLTDGVTLSGFMLTNGHTEVSGDPVTNRSGGGAWCAPGAVIDRCRIARCSAADSGGGVYSGFLRSSALFDNYAERDGGGAHLSALSLCSVVSNRATHCGGGVSACAATNCIVYFNASASSGANHYTSTTERCCSTPSQAGITTTLDPRFMNRSLGNLSLSNGSPCVNAGLVEFWMDVARDLAGNPRVIGGTVDMGAYESTGGATESGVPWQWLLDHGLATDGSADGDDVDGDGLTAFAERKARTHPQDPFSTLGMGSAAAADLGDGIFPVFRWASVSGCVYRVGLSTNLLVGFDATLADDVPATPPENTVTDRTDAAASFKVYRVEVK